MLQKACVFLVVLIASTFTLAEQLEPPREWVDADTGHRVIRLSDDTGSRTLYFHDSAYTPEGDKFIFNTPGGVVAIDVAAIGTSEQKLTMIVAGAGGGQMARRSRGVYVCAWGTGAGDTPEWPGTRRIGLRSQR